MTTPTERIRKALADYDAAKTGREEAHAIGALMTEATPDALSALLAEMASLRADAERYRHLRNRSNDCGLCTVMVDGWSEEYSCQAIIRDVLDGTYLDAAIDAAIDAALATPPSDPYQQPR
jgi:hypothetical protein